MAKVLVYSSMFCGYCHAAKKLLTEKGAAFEEIDVFFSPAKRQEMIERAGGRTSVPQIFIGEHHVAGCDALYALEAEGKLDELLEEAA